MLAKVAKSCNHLNLSSTNVTKMCSLFCQKLSRFIASKSWEKLQSSQLIASKQKSQKGTILLIYLQQNSQKCNVFFNQLNLPPANVFFFFWGGERKNLLNLSQAKIAENAISESKIKNIARNHIHDLSKQLVITGKARNLKL